MDFQFIECVQERDIDLLLMEEFECNEGFRIWFLEKIGLNYSTVRQLVGVWHSLKEAGLGESDIIVCFGTKTNNKVAILIENKIDAKLQPAQAERYLQRGRLGIKKAYWQEFRTCIIAPATYLEATDTSVFQKQIAYEELLHWFSESICGDRRIAFKSKLLREAIEANRRGYQVVENPEVTEFMRQYWEVANIEFPDLQMRKPEKKGQKFDWPEFSPTSIPSGIRLIHKMKDGCVDLQFDGEGNSFDSFKKVVTPFLDEYMVCKKRGKSASVLIQVPSIDRFQPFSDQRDSVYRAIDAARNLAEWYTRNHSYLASPAN